MFICNDNTKNESLKNSFANSGAVKRKSKALSNLLIYKPIRIKLSKCNYKLLVAGTE